MSGGGRHPPVCKICRKVIPTGAPRVRVESMETSRPSDGAVVLTSFHSDCWALVDEALGRLVKA